MDTPGVAAFGAASRFFVQAVAAVPRDRYQEQWSDEWSVLDLIGHGNRGHVLPVEYYERPVPAAEPEALREYLLPKNIAARGREAVPWPPGVNVTRVLGAYPNHPPPGNGSGAVIASPITTRTASIPTVSAKR